MVFDYNKEKSLFDNNDEFGIQEYRLDSSYIFNSNLTPVKLIRYNEQKAKDLNGDFLGVTVASSYPNDNYETIWINVMSRQPSQKEITEYGYDDKGIIIYECYANWDLEINNKDLIKFIADFDLNIKKDELYRIKIEDAGMYQGQFTRKQFTITKIQNG